MIESVESLRKQLGQVSRELLKMTKAKINADIKLRKLKEKMKKIKDVLKNS